MARAQDRIEFIQVRHEEMAAFMACGRAKFTGEVGICLATSGPGAIHLLNGVLVTLVLLLLAVLGGQWIIYWGRHP